MAFLSTMISGSRLIMIMLLVMFVAKIADGLSLQQPLPRSYQVSQDILEGLQSSVGNSAALDLERDFYDESTGMYSEGVWHNCMGGMAALQLSSGVANPGISSSRRQRYRDDAHRIAESLFRHSWDGKSFRRRSWSGNWDHSKLQLAGTDVEQPNYYLESSEHRCIQHAIALAFWSNLSQDSKDSSTIRSQQRMIVNQFVDEFWNGERWTTISRTQGSGTTLRPSASSGTANAAAKDSVSSPAEAGTYFRAVDQAIAILALLQHLHLLDDNENGSTDKDERDRIVHLVERTCADLLDEDDGFGFGNLPNACTYLGIDRNRNFWHEGWVMLALTSARDYINVWPMDIRGSRLKMLWNDLMERYTSVDTADNTIWHWPLSQKDMKSNVRYCGDNALAYAIRRNLQFNSKRDENDDDVAFWRFVEDLRSETNPHRLASVADVYRQVRLHPNTELAALLVWPPVD